MDSRVVMLCPALPTFLYGDMTMHCSTSLAHTPENWLLCMHYICASERLSLIFYNPVSICNWKSTRKTGLSIF